MGIDESRHQELSVLELEYLRIDLAFLSQYILQVVRLNVVHYPLDVPRWAYTEQTSWKCRI